MKWLATVSVLQSISLLIIVGNLMTPAQGVNFQKYRETDIQGGVFTVQNQRMTDGRLEEEQLREIIYEELERYFRERGNAEILAKE